MRTKLILASLFLIPGLAAADDVALEREFEGRQATALVDLPGDSSGADVYVGRRTPLDFTQLGARNRRFGASIRRGDQVTITKIKVKDKLIEVHLDGGGYGFTDSVGAGTPSSTVSKTKREKRLQDEVKLEPDPAKKRKLQEELDDLKQERRREEARLQAENAQAEAALRAVEAEKRLRSGSRINLRFDGGVSSADLEPDALIAALEGYLSFAAPGSGEAPKLSKGMSRDAVSAIHGLPVNCTWESGGAVSVETCRHEDSRGVLEAQYVEGVLVRYKLESR